MESPSNSIQSLQKRKDELQPVIQDIAVRGTASKSRTERKALRAQVRQLLKEFDDLELEIRDLKKIKGSVENPEKSLVDDSAETNAEASVNRSAETVAKYPISFIEPKRPRKSPPVNYSVLRFEADGHVYCFGQLDKPKDFNSMAVLPIIKTIRGEAPSYQIKLMFPRDQVSNPAIRFDNPRSHTVLLKFRPGAYTVDDHVVTDKTEFEDFVKDAPQQIRGKAKECMDQQKLYRVTLSYEEKGILQMFYPNLYSSNVPAIQTIFESMKLIPGCKTISIFTWMYPDLPANLQYLYQEQMKYSSPLEPYYHKETKGLAAYVQWGKINIPDNEYRFEANRTFDGGFPEYNLVVHNGVARDKLAEIDIINKIRATPIKMTVTQAGPGGQYYLVFLQFPDFGEGKKIIDNAGKGLITWDPPPTSKQAEDKPWGWIAYLRPDTGLQQGAVVAMIHRPEDPANPTKDRPMPSPNKIGDTLKSTMVYYKVGFEVSSTKALLKAGDELRYKWTKGQPNAEIKRKVLCGMDQVIHFTTDLLEGLSNEEISNISQKLTPSQRSFILDYCRKLLNGLGFLQGPAGSGKTSIMKALVRIAQKRGWKVAILTDSNSAADNVVQTIASPEIMVVRVHSLGLERRHLLKDFGKDVDYEALKSADADPDEEEDDVKDRYVVDTSQKTRTDKGARKDTKTDAEKKAKLEAKVEAANKEAELAEGWQDDDMMITFNEHVLKESLIRYRKAKSIMNPEDPRMKMVVSAIWAWILRVLSLIKSDEYSNKVKVKLEQLAKEEKWEKLRDLIMKSKTQHHNATERRLYGDLIKECCVSIAGAADVVVCTVSQFANEWSKDMDFPLILIDEATAVSEAQFLLAWRNLSTMISIGDQCQLGGVIGSTPKNNPFTDQMLKSAFVRFIENGWPYAMLLEVMRMTTGLEQLTSDIFYRGELKPGVTTPLSHANRAMSRQWKTKMGDKYPTLREEPEGLVYPVFFNSKSQCVGEIGGGSSKVNLYNIAAVIEHVLWVIESGIAKAHEIGIATPYGGQVNAYANAMDKVAKDERNVKDILIGTSQWWQGKQAPYMVVDMVRATNDYGVLGVANDHRRLNVLLSQQQYAMVIFGDLDCVKSLTTDPMELQKLAHENRFVTDVFKWIQTKGRIINIATVGISQKYVTLEEIMPEETKAAASTAQTTGWGNETSAASTDTTTAWNPTITTQASSEPVGWDASNVTDMDPNVPKWKRGRAHDDGNW